MYFLLKPKKDTLSQTYKEYNCILVSFMARILTVVAFP